MKRLLLVATVTLLPFIAGAVEAPPGTTPTIADIAYGPDPKQKLDLYLPEDGKGAGPYPILIWIHGGGWIGGDKLVDVCNPRPYTDHGCAVASINYRLTRDARAQKIEPPAAAVTGDNRRALQYLRLHAADWHLDPARIVVAGGSAGALSALYLGCEGEQANPQSLDPVERVSTKVLGVGAANAQASIDPQRIHEWVPGCAFGYWALEAEGPMLFNDAGLPPFNQCLAEREKWLPEIKKYSPDWLLTKDAAPIYFVFGQPLPAPDTKPWPHSDQLVHSPLWGVAFQKLAQEKGVPCYNQYPGHPPEKYHGMADFLLQQAGIVLK